jgi:integrase/recombinase XerD
MWISRFRRVRLHSFRNHEKNCPHRAKGRGYDKCKCTFGVDGTIDGHRFAKSLRTRNADVARAMIREIEEAEPGEINVFQTKAADPKSTTVTEAKDGFLSECKNRELSDHTIYKYQLLLSRLESTAAQNGLLQIKELNTDFLRLFRSHWTHRGTSALKRLEELRAFFRFCRENGWISDNPAVNLKPPRFDEPPREPFTEEEMERIERACSNLRGTPHRLQLKVLVRLLIDTGLRIGDVVNLQQDKIVQGQLRVRTEKTGTPVCIPLTNALLSQLDSVQPSNGFYFWTGESKLKSRIGNWQRSLKRLFRAAGVDNGFAHRFRHTFAKRLLVGIPPERVAILLGHSSPTITLKYYMRWVKERQDQLERDVLTLHAAYARYSRDDKHSAR